MTMMMMMFLFFSQSFDHQQQQCGKCGVETGAEEMAVTMKSPSPIAIPIKRYTMQIPLRILQLSICSLANNPSLRACVYLSLSPSFLQTKPTISNLQLQRHLSEKRIWVANLFAILGKIF
jgi:hypothetical protein